MSKLPPPPPVPTGPLIREPPKIDLDRLEVKNTSSSNAGAGSGEFHKYRAQRRAEENRLREMDKKALEEEQQVEFLQRRAELIMQSETASAKKAAKRKRAKEAKREKAKRQKMQKQSEAESGASTEKPEQSDESQGKSASDEREVKENS